MDEAFATREDSRTRSAYTAPAVEVIGTVAQLTSGGTGSGTDSMQGASATS
jgi:hypothetical protein